MYSTRRPSLAQATMALATWPPGENISSTKALARVGRKLGHEKQGVGGVQANSDDIESGHPLRLPRSR
jgi:hypothetical protein